MSRPDIHCHGEETNLETDIQNQNKIASKSQIFKISTPMQLFKSILLSMKSFHSVTLSFNICHECPACRTNGAQAYFFSLIHTSFHWLFFLSKFVLENLV